MSSTVRVPGNIACAPQAVAEDLGADLRLRGTAGARARSRCRRSRPARARIADHARAPPAPAPAAAGHRGQRRPPRGPRSGPPPSRRFSTSRIALSNSPTSASKATPAVPARLVLGQAQVAAAGQVAEEVALAARAARRRARPPPASICARMRSTASRTRGLRPSARRAAAAARPRAAPELRAVLLRRKRARASSTRRRSAALAATPSAPSSAADQREARVDQRLARAPPGRPRRSCCGCW